MCHASDYAHLMGEDLPAAAFEPSATPADDPEATRRPRDVSGPFIEYAPTWMAGLPAEEDALEFARTLVFGERGRVACQRPSFDPYWCIVHSDDFADGAGACESAR